MMGISATLIRSCGPRRGERIGVVRRFGRAVLVFVFEGEGAGWRSWQGHGGVYGILSGFRVPRRGVGFWGCLLLAVFLFSARGFISQDELSGLFDSRDAVHVHAKGKSEGSRKVD